MNHESSRVPSTQSMLLLLLVSAGGDAVANTYFKCVDAKGAVTVQQTRCAVSAGVTGCAPSFAPGGPIRRTLGWLYRASGSCP